MSKDELRIEKLYGERDIACYADRPRNLGAMLAATARRYPSQECVRDGDRSLSFGELDIVATNVASNLALAGCVKGDRVGLLLGNRAEFVVMLMAVWRMGAIAVPIGTRMSRVEVEYVLADSGCSLLVTERDSLARAPCNDQSNCRLIVVDAEDGDASEDYKALIAPPVRPAQLGSDFDDQSPACIMYTSGTTGKPKGAVLAHIGFFHGARHYECRFGYVAGDRILLAVPVAHISGLLAVVAVAVQVGACIVMMRQFKASSLLDMIEDQAVTATVLVPAMYNLCVLDETSRQLTLPRWRIAHFGGGAMPLATIATIRRLWPHLRLYNGFGATETTAAVALTQEGEVEADPTSLGRALPGIEFRIVDGAGNDCPPGAAGELWIRGPGNAIEYWRKPDATRETFVNGYWRSGDVATLDASGRLRILDRIKDMINRGGFKIYSIEIEDVLNVIPDVIESAIVPLPCPVLGERVHAIVVSDAPLDSQAVKTHCAAVLSDYKVPDLITVTNRPLPRNANGKILKRDLARAMNPDRAPLTQE